MNDASRSRWRFGAFTLSPARRQLCRDGAEVPLIPRYLDLLQLLIERRHEAVSRRDIFDTVWSDVVVSDGALTQAVRTLRRALGDDPRQPQFIRTVSRHGYQFVHPALVEESDAAAVPNPAPPPAPLPSQVDAVDDDVEEDGPDEVDDADEAATTLERARQRLGALRTAVASRWGSAVAGGAVAGLTGGFLGGILLRFGPGAVAGDTLPLALAVLGLAVGAAGAAGVGAGLALAEAASRSMRLLALPLGAALGGGAAGLGGHLLARWTLVGLFGRDFSPLGGGVEGAVLGAALGLGYALTTREASDGLATPHGGRRATVAIGAGVCCALAGLLLGATGYHLGAMSLDVLARSFRGSQVGLAPLAHLLGESDTGVFTRSVISAGEGLLFGTGVAYGLTRRPRR